MCITQKTRMNLMDYAQRTLRLYGMIGIFDPEPDSGMIIAFFFSDYRFYHSPCSKIVLQILLLPTIFFGRIFSL